MSFRNLEGVSLLVSIADSRCPFCGKLLVLRTLNLLAGPGMIDEARRFGFIPYCSQCNWYDFDLERYDEPEIWGIG